MSDVHAKVSAMRDIMVATSAGVKDEIEWLRLKVDKDMGDVPADFLMKMTNCAAMSEECTIHDIQVRNKLD